MFMKAGADIIKMFPGGLFGPAIIKNFWGPMPQMKMMPTGGVDVDNIGEWIQAPTATAPPARRQATMTRL